MPVQQWEAPRRIATTPAHEGPVWFSDENALYLTTVARSGRGDAPVVDVVRLRFDDSLRLVGCDVVAEDANAANGMCATVDGCLLVCEQGRRQSRARISRLDRRTGRRETVCDSADGAPLTSPNDIVQSADGTIWFTDPGYGHLQGFREAPALPDGVRRVDGTGVATTVTTRFDKPNGIALSPDGRRLYVGDSGANHEPGSYDARRRPTPTDGSTSLAPPGFRSWTPTERCSTTSPSPEQSTSASAGPPATRCSSLTTAASGRFTPSERGPSHDPHEEPPGRHRRARRRRHG